MTSENHNEAGFDLDQVDRLLTTTRSVRKRLDFDRDVPDRVIFDCIDLAEQAPSGGNDASRRWIVIKDEATKLKTELEATFAAWVRSMDGSLGDYNANTGKNNAKKGEASN